MKKEDEEKPWFSYNWSWPIWLAIPILVLTVMCVMRGCVEYVHDVQQTISR